MDKAPDIIRVLIVDDSAIYRNMLRNILTNRKKIEVIGTANHGGIAVEKTKQYRPDLIIMDMEMPVMNGSDAIREIRKDNSDVKILVYSGQSRASIQSTISILDCGVVDFLMKPDGTASGIDETKKIISDALIPKIYQLFYLDVSDYEDDFKENSDVFSEKNEIKKIKVTKGIQKKTDSGDQNLHLRLRPDIIVIASSTGGPGALEHIFSDIGGDDCVPILIVQHMPVGFTKIFAERLNGLSHFNIKEATHDEIVKNGTVYIAPGDYHMEVRRNASDGHMKIQLHQKEKLHYVRPAADYLFASVSKLYHDKCYGMVLTGMGDDGAAGAVCVKESGGHILIQSEASAVVWGMAGATYRNGSWDQMGDLDFCKDVLKSFIGKIP
ncbi:MAG: chemotaxis-specific protein-glutamate methyltransferase CheB [Deltaproteobacteria bacterium]|nr:chemotaxis-specific protein-glutamate methyltransferase CheB [Deltaproteobacteria bacterium]